MILIHLGMNYLHSLATPIVHNDLKSSNILVEIIPNVRAKIIDFGKLTWYKR